MSNSVVMSEFMKIAEEQKLLKRAKYPDNPYQEDPDVIKDKRLSAPDKSIVEEAHPEPAYVAEARGDGGLVENEVENQKKVIDIVNKMPTGALVGSYATMATELIKMAEYYDKSGEYQIADMFVDAANDIIATLSKEQLPLL